MNKIFTLTASALFLLTSSLYAQSGDSYMINSYPNMSISKFVPSELSLDKKSATKAHIELVFPNAQPKSGDLLGHKHYYGVLLSDIQNGEFVSRKELNSLANNLEIIFHSTGGVLGLGKTFRLNQIAEHPVVQNFNKPSARLHQFWGSNNSPIINQPVYFYKNSGKGTVISANLYFDQSFPLLLKDNDLRIEFFATNLSALTYDLYQSGYTQVVLNKYSFDDLDTPPEFHFVKPKNISYNQNNNADVYFTNESFANYNYGSKWGPLEVIAFDKQDGILTRNASYRIFHRDGEIIGAELTHAEINNPNLFGEFCVKYSSTDTSNNTSEEPYFIEKREVLNNPPVVTIAPGKTTTFVSNFSWRHLFAEQKNNLLAGVSAIDPEDGPVLVYIDVRFVDENGEPGEFLTNDELDDPFLKGDFYISYQGLDKEELVGEALLKVTKITAYKDLYTNFNLSFIPATKDGEKAKLVFETNRAEKEFISDRTIQSLNFLSKKGNGDFKNLVLEGNSNGSNQLDIVVNNATNGSNQRPYAGTKLGASYNRVELFIQQNEIAFNGIIIPDSVSVGGGLFQAPRLEFTPYTLDDKYTITIEVDRDNDLYNDIIKGEASFRFNYMRDTSKRTVQNLSFGRKKIIHTYALSHQSRIDVSPTESDYTNINTAPEFVFTNKKRVFGINEDVTISALFEKVNAFDQQDGWINKRDILISSVKDKNGKEFVNTEFILDPNLHGVSSESSLSKIEITGDYVVEYSVNDSSENTSKGTFTFHKQGLTDVYSGLNITFEPAVRNGDNATKAYLKIVTKGENYITNSTNKISYLNLLLQREGNSFEYLFDYSKWQREFKVYREVEGSEIGVDLKPYAYTSNVESFPNKNGVNYIVDNYSKSDTAPSSKTEYSFIIEIDPEFPLYNNIINGDANFEFNYMLKYGSNFIAQSDLQINPTEKTLKGVNTKPVITIDGKDGRKVEFVIEQTKTVTTHDGVQTGEPEINITNTEDITSAELLKTVWAFDNQDGILDDKVKIVSVTKEGSIENLIASATVAIAPDDSNYSRKNSAVNSNSEIDAILKTLLDEAKYYITFEVTDSSGNTTTETSFVERKIKVNVENVTTVGVDKFELKDQVSIYPNPTSDFVNIELAQPITELFVHDMSGRMLYSNSNVNSSFYTLDVNNYPSGVFVLTVKSGNETASFRIVKK